MGQRRTARSARPAGARTSRPPSRPGDSQPGTSVTSATTVPFADDVHPEVRAPSARRTRCRASAGPRARLLPRPRPPPHGPARSRRDSTRRPAPARARSPPASSARPSAPSAHATPAAARPRVPVRHRARRRAWWRAGAGARDGPGSRRCWHERRGRCQLRAMKQTHPGSLDPPPGPSLLSQPTGRRPEALARLSPAGCVMCSRNSNRYVHSGGRTGVPCVTPGPSGSRRRPGRPTAPHLGSHLAQLGSMDAAHTAQRRGTFFSGEVRGWRRTGGRWERTRGHCARRRSASSSPPRRKALSAELVDTRGLKIQARFLATPYYHHARTVALYAPIRGEVPTRDILTAGLADGKVICYPLSHVRGRVLSFRAVRSEAELEPGRLGVREPTDAAELDPGGADRPLRRPGPRLHRGRQAAGARRRVLRRHAQGRRQRRSRRVGLAFAEQMVDDLPTNEDDVDVDLVVTENEVFRGPVPRHPTSLDHVIVLFMGDVVGKPGVLAVRTLLPASSPGTRSTWSIANAENSEGGAGISGESAEALLGARGEPPHLGQSLLDQAADPSLGGARTRTCCSGRPTTPRAPRARATPSSRPRTGGSWASSTSRVGCS